MNIQIVAQNLRNTLKGKEEMLNMLKSRRVIDKIAIRYLEVNIVELKRILEDVEQCEDQYQDGYSAGYDDGWEEATLNERN